MSAIYTEADYENSIIELFQNMGYHHVYGPDIERDFDSPLYEEELIDALHRLNPTLPEDAIQDAIYKIKNFENGELAQKNEVFTDYLQHGIEARYFEKGEEHSSLVYLIDYKNPDNNSYVAANQWTFIEHSNKRPDVLLFINGLPLVLIELKSPSREETDASEAFLQIRNYMQEIPSMFIYNCICVMSDFLISKAGTITSGEDRYMEWKTKDGNYEATQYAQFDTFFEGIFQKERLVDIIKNFICFSDEGLESFKIMAAYHQYFAVKKAIESTKHATVTDGKGGVFWHTQGSGKSLSMVFYAHLLQEALDSPTIVVLTDRNDLDDQLYGQFAKCKRFLRQEPIHAESREHLRTLLDGRKANGIIFTTMQKFEESHEPLSERRNIIVMADEAHRSQYGLREKVDAKTGEIKVGTARIIRNSLPNATYIGFTGTPISMKDRSTREVFGDYIDVYDMTQAVEDGATRPVYYESRVIKLKLDEATLKLIDAEYDLMANSADMEVVQRSKRELGQMEAVLGNEQTIDSLVQDIIAHYEGNRETLLTGKAMIVAYSRDIAMKIYHRMLELRPNWTEKVAVVMTESNKDPEDWRAIIGNKHHKEELAKKFKDNDSPLKIAIVVDMWLTGFDVPSLATMYVYKPMKGHNLMQAIARVNRVFRDKEGGLIVDYVGIATALKEAMNDYSARDKKNYGDTDVAKVAYPKFLEKISVCRDLFHGYDYSKFISGSNLDRSKIISGAVNFIVDPCRKEDRDAFAKEALMLKQALSLCSSMVEEDMRIEAAFFEAVRVLVMRLVTQGEGKKLSLKEMNEQINELLKSSVKSDGVINLFSDISEGISIFDPNFLEEISKMKEKNLAVELLKKLIAEQVQIYRHTNVVKSQKFSEIIQGVMNRYLNGMLTNEQVIEELLALAKQIAEAKKEGEKLGLTADELAFYDALTKPQAIKDFYENEELIAITKELAEALRKNRTIDWQKRESARAKMRMMIKKLLKKHKYPPEGMDDAVQTVMTQCELWTDNSDMQNHDGNVVPFVQKEKNQSYHLDGASVAEDMIFAIRNDLENRICDGNPNNIAIAETLRNGMHMTTQVSDAQFKKWYSECKIFASMVDTGYLVDFYGKFYIGSDKYLERGENGNIRLTQYAKEHEEECCPRFVIDSKNYNLIKLCFTPILGTGEDGYGKKIISVAHNNAEANPDKNGVVPAELRQDTTDKMLAGIRGCNFGNALKKLMSSEFCHRTFRSLQDETGLNVRTIKLMQGGKSLTKRNVVSICLGLHLPPLVSRKMLELADKPITGNNWKDDDAYIDILHKCWAWDYLAMYEYLKKNNQTHLVHNPNM